MVKLKVGDPLARVFFFNLCGRPNQIHDSKPREIPPAIERVQRPSVEDLALKGEIAVLDDVLRLVDPPHFEHAFVTHRIFTHALEASTLRVSGLSREIAVLTILTMLSLLIGLVIALTYIGSVLRSTLPDFFSHTIAHIFAAFLIWLVAVVSFPAMRRLSLDAIARLRK